METHAGAGRTLFDKVWDDHIVADLGDGRALLHVDRHVLHDLSGTRALVWLREHGRSVRNPELCVATPDHSVSTLPGRDLDSAPRSRMMAGTLREECARWGIRLFDLDDPEQGIVHVVGPELGVTLPGTLLLCGDSHTCTHGALGALAWGIGSSEVEHVLATQTIVQQRPKRMRVTFNGLLDPSVTPKDAILFLIGEVGAAAGNGHAVEYAGSTIEAMSVEGRLTLCNLSIELAARVGMVAPDDTTFEYLYGRRFAPKEEAWDAAVAYWKSLPSDPEAEFDKELTIDASGIAPQVTWGTSPQDVIAIDGAIPDPELAETAERRDAISAALEYTGLTPGTPIEGVGVDWVFIGSCTNSRISDLRAAARIADGRKVAEGVRAWVVPGSKTVKREAEAEGLDKVFLTAGFEWREPGCSMCVAANSETVGVGERCVSTSNRNFMGRQGAGSRTHLASPAMAAAAAVTGRITDVRKLET